MGAVHPRVLGYLGRALSLELTAVQQFMTLASLVELWGDSASAEQFRRDTVEEMRHAEAIVQRMLALGVAPAASQLKPVAHASDLAGLLQHNARLEQDLIDLYADAVRFCLLIGDAASHELFAALLADEQGHARDIAAWLKQVRVAGHGASGTLARATF